MPTYEYQCKACNHLLEELQKITDAPLEVCPACGQSTLKRGPGGGIALSFKGSGFYITDYTKKGKEAESPKKSECCPCGKASSCEK